MQLFIKTNCTKMLYSKTEIFTDEHKLGNFEI